MKAGCSYYVELVDTKYGMDEFYIQRTFPSGGDFESDKHRPFMMLPLRKGRNYTFLVVEGPVYEENPGYTAAFVGYKIQSPDAFGWLVMFEHDDNDEPFLHNHSVQLKQVRFS